jgi:hypothetical protein
MVGVHILNVDCKLTNDRQTIANSCFVDRASRYIHVIKTNLMHYLSLVYFVNQPLHVSGIFVAHHWEVYCIYPTAGTCWAFQLSGFRWNSVSTQPTDRQLKSTTHTSCCINTVYLPVMCYKYARNM